MLPYWMHLVVYFGDIEHTPGHASTQPPRTRPWIALMHGEKHMTMNKRVYHPDGAQPPPDEGWVFVFGSNLAGRHSEGSALVAAQHFGAQRGVGFGWTSESSFAIPVKTGQLETLSIRAIAVAVMGFVGDAQMNPNRKFWVSRVGCELEGYSDEQIARLFQRAPGNCSFAAEWKSYF